MTTIRIALAAAVALVLAAGCGGGSGGYGGGGYQNDPATMGMDHYLNGDFNAALTACKELESRDLSSEEMQFHVRGCLALRPAISLLANDHQTARQHIAAGCQSAPDFGHDKDHYCAFTLVTFSLHATEEQLVAADQVLADIFLMECGVSVNEIITIIEEMKAQMDQQSGSGYY
jgi:hypothetical protein